MSQSSKITPLATLDPVEREALAWVVRLTSGDATESDAAALRAWRAADLRHDRAFRSAAKLWRQVGEIHEGPSVRVPRGITRRWLLAAGVAGLSVVGAQQTGIVPSFGRLLADHRTGVGERRTVLLPENSRIEMNTATALSVGFSAEQRRIDLVEGEAVFAVVTDRARPFRVYAGNGWTQALGTEFCVRREGDGVRVTCLHGEVEVTAGRSVRLTAGQQVRYGAALGEVGKVDLDMATAWRLGLLVFRDERLEAVIGEVNRYRRGWIVLTDAVRREQRVSGVFHLDRPDELLRHIQATLGLTETRISDRLILLS